MTEGDKGVAPALGRTAQVATHGSAGVAERSHTDVRDRLSEYLDGSLADSQRQQIDGHLGGCRPCRAILGTLRATKQKLEQLGRPKAPTGARGRILDRVRQAQQDAEDSR